MIEENEQNQEKAKIGRPYGIYKHKSPITNKPVPVSQWRSELRQLKKEKRDAKEAQLVPLSSLQFFQGEKKSDLKTSIKRKFQEIQKNQMDLWAMIAKL